MRIRKWVFLRHFEKAPHPFSERLTIDQLRAESLEALQERVTNWDRYDYRIRPITERGRDHALATRPRLEQFFESQGGEPAHVYVSRYRRTNQSAALIAPGFHNAKFIMDEPSITEVRPGLEAFATFDCIAERFPTYAEKVKAQNYLTVPVPLGDCKAGRREQLRDFLDRLKRVDGHVLVITHAGVIDGLQQIVHGWTDDYVINDRLQKPDRTPSGAAFLCAYDSECNQIYAMDNCHLFTPCST